MSKKIILAAILLCTLIPFAAQATITRVIGLGGEGANYIVKDAFNPSIWPQLIVDYPNLAGGEFYGPPTDVWDFRKAYLNYNFGEDNGVLQFSLDRNPGIRSQFGVQGFPGMYRYESVPVIPDADGDATTVENASKFSAIYGRRLGEMKAGLQLVYSGQSAKTSGTTATEVSASLIGLNLGISAMEDKLDASLGFETVGFTDEAGSVTNRESDGSMALNIAARYWYDYSTRAALVPNFRFLTLKDAWTGGPSGATVDSSGSYTDIKLGLGHNWTPVDNALAIFEFGIDMVSNKVEMTSGGTSSDMTTKFNGMPYWRLGFETQIFGWLNGRLGAERGWISYSNDLTAAGEPEGSFSTTNTFLGATAHWNRLYADVLVQPDFIQNGPNFLSGYNNNIFTRVSLKYDFNQ